MFEAFTKFLKTFFNFGKDSIFKRTGKKWKMFPCELHPVSPNVNILGNIYQNQENNIGTILLNNYTHIWCHKFSH